MSSMGPCTKCKKVLTYVTQCEDCGAKFCSDCSGGIKCQNCKTLKIPKVIY